MIHCIPKKHRTIGTMKSIGSLLSRSATCSTSGGRKRKVFSLKLLRNASLSESGHVIEEMCEFRKVNVDDLPIQSFWESCSLIQCIYCCLVFSQQYPDMNCTRAHSARLICHPQSIGWFWLCSKYSSGLWGLTLRDCWSKTWTKEKACSTRELAKD